MKSEVLDIVALGAAGDGIARRAGGSIFVPGALPGESVRAEIAGNRARPEAWLRESPDRVTPPCRHFGACGGCVLQHWAAAPYAAWKREKLVAALTAAGFPEAPVAPLVSVPPASRRRADLALRRTPAGIALGLHAIGQAAVVNLAECHVLDPRLVALFAPLRALLRRLPALKREGSAVLNLLDTGPDLLLRTDGPLDAAGRALLAGFAREHGLPRIAWAQGNGPAENAAQLGPVALRFGTASVAPPPGAFLQASPGGEAAIIAAVLAGLPAKLPAKARIVELHAGLGTLSFALATRARVEAYEGAAEAVAALAAAAGSAGARIRAARRDLDRQPLAPAELQNLASLVLDPPYAGAAAQMPLLARARVPRIIYVSCNPGALARDAKPLALAGYRVLAATPIDQFPWSAHLEAVVVFSPATT
ncbi:class I SAM-dependent RNA methyltransferase [Siccirubricoccus sp. KC 17139]|uniref:Class I SAM-dependent RNA methyltransferase n=1 Tax=Siccirubricoccus soli TaxID=2899147 RepID=A0ABT1D0Z4_9PROT|nr:class I SAM-dependent RNA methyltransferase [Siccirubricoccus soli]MCO6415571.1 class I SAM-dependent RNA methyltransferase [Siccirubricoccus soli]MCP2681703.1 class I SAM-dependent RNA methyltransferase [Siccirubricoccus soli]